MFIVEEVFRKVIVRLVIISGDSESGLSNSYSAIESILKEEKIELLLCVTYLFDLMNEMSELSYLKLMR